MNKLLRYGDDPILKTVCEPVQPGESVIDLLELMKRALKKSSDGVGLAAPQVGVAKRVIIVQDTKDGTTRWLNMINPEVVEQCELTELGTEGCLSFPGIYKQVRRPNWVDVQYEDKYRQLKRTVCYGFSARIVFHELDHLAGVCLIGDPNFKGHA